MSQQFPPADQSRIVRYLLGDLEEEDTSKVEEQYFLDKVFFDHVVDVEDRLIREYLRGSLTQGDSVLFERKYMLIPELRKRLVVAIQLQAEAIAAQARFAAETTTQIRFWKRPWSLPAAVMAIAGVLMVLLAGWWLESQNVHLRRELARSTAPVPGVDASRSPSDTEENRQARSGVILTAILSPGLTKSLGESQPRDIRVAADVKEMRLQFDLPGTTEDYTVKLEIMRVDAANRRLIFTRQGLGTSVTPAGRTVLVTLAGNELQPGDYIAFVRNDSRGASEGILESYSFRVLRQ